MATLDVTRRDRSAYHHVWIILALLIPATLLAFAPTYFRGLTFSQLPVTTLVHLHTALMVLWVLLLISQAWLIRAKQYRIHRWTGRSSFVIVPLIVLVTLMLDRETLNRKPEVTTFDARIEIFFWGQLIPFVMAWALALMYRRHTPIHMRYMVSTVFAAGTAFMARIILNWFAWLPGMDNINNTVAANGAVLLLMLLALIANDWRLGIGRSPFWLVAITTLTAHIGFFTFTKTDWWMSFVLWYAGVPSWGLNASPTTLCRREDGAAKRHSVNQARENPLIVLIVLSSVLTTPERRPWMSFPAPAPGRPEARLRFQGCAQRLSDPSTPLSTGSISIDSTGSSISTGASDQAPNGA